MANLPTSPDGLLYAALIRRIDTQVPTIAGKTWLLAAPRTKPAAYALFIPISGSEAQSFDGPAELRTKVLQIAAVTGATGGVEGAMQIRTAIDLALVGTDWEDTIGTKIVAIQGILPAGDGYEAWDPDTEQYSAFLRIEIQYKIRNAA